MKHRKGSVARAIQEWFLSAPYERMIANDNDTWHWFAIPNNPYFCVAMEWQDGYDPADRDAYYGKFMSNDGYVINVSIKLTDEFSFNGTYALYAETYFLTDEEMERYGLVGGVSISNFDENEEFYSVSHFLAKEFNSLRRKKKLR